MSLRRRLTTYYIVLLLVTLLVIGMGVYISQRQVLVDEITADLSQAARVIQEDFDDSNEPFSAYFNGRRNLSAPAIVNAFINSPIAAQVWGFQNRQFGIVSEFENQPLPLKELVSRDQMEQALQGVSQRVVAEQSGQRVMMLSTPLIFDGESIGMILVGQSLATVDSALRTLLLVLVVGGGLMLLMTGAMAWYITRRGLQPVEAIASTAEQIVRAEDLSRRIPETGQRDELGRLVAIINNLLARLEVLFNLQRRLTADVSHELRTPLAAMRGNLEILRRGAAKDPALLEETLGDVEREAARLTRLVNDLLLLAQSEAGVQIRREPVELDTLLLEVFRELRPLAQGVHLRIGAEDQASVLGDRDRLKQALLNLTHNAICFTPSGGEVCLRLEVRDHEVYLSISDSGVGISEEELPHIFDRFYRVERSRERGSGGAGLGLAIVRWVAEVHGGRVEVSSALGQGSSFTLVLPVAETQGERLVVSEPLTLKKEF